MKAQRLSLILASLVVVSGLAAQRPATASAPALSEGEHTYREVLQSVDDWLARFPRLVNRIELGKSVQGRPLFVLCISNAGAGAPEVWLGAGTHGGERSERDAMWLVEQLLSLSGDPAVRELLRTRVLWVQPMINPDGIVAGARTNARGVDLDRNFGARQTPGSGPKSAAHHPGPEPFSEPETRAVRDFLRGRPYLRASLVLQRATSCVVVPPVGEDGAIGTAVQAAGAALATTMGGAWQRREPVHFAGGRGRGLDWVFAELGVTAFAWELPAAGTELPTPDDPRWKGLLHLLERAEEYPEREQERTASRPASAPATDPFDFASAWQGVVAEFRDGCERAGVVGGSLLFVRGNEVLGSECFGLADRDGKRAVDRDTVFHWASITKTFTGIAVMQLRDRGKLRLEQPIVDFVPELRAAYDPQQKLDGITLRHLLSHTAGFRGPTWPFGGDKPWHPHEPTRFEQLVAMMPYTEVEFVPGSRFSYSNPGIVFLGRAIELISGDDYEVYTDKNVLRPLGMLRSYFDVTPYHLQRHRSHSYAQKGEVVADLGPDFDTGVTVSNGGLNAPLPDMARYLAFLLAAGERGADAAGVLARASLEQMFEPVVPIAATAPTGDQMGLTFFVQSVEGERFITHTGGQRSFVSFFYVHPGSGTGAVGAFNTSTAGPVMAKTRSSCMRNLSLRMLRK